MTLAAILALFATQALPIPPDGYGCYQRFEIDGFQAYLSRDYPAGLGDRSYLLQLRSSDPGSTFPAMLWSIGEPPRGKAQKYYRQARPESVVFDQGPEYLSFGDFPALDLTDGAVRARYLAGDIDIGMIDVRSARQTRQAYRRHWSGPSASLTSINNPDLLARLAGAGVATAVLIDATGRELARRSVTLPAPATLKTIFTEHRTQMERDSTAFLKTWQPGDWSKPDAGAACRENEPPEAGI